MFNRDSGGAKRENAIVTHHSKTQQTSLFLVLQVIRKEKKTYNTRYSLVVTDPTTNPALTGLSMGERTGSRVFQWVWSYVVVCQTYVAYEGIVKKRTTLNVKRHNSSDLEYLMFINHSLELKCQMSPIIGWFTSSKAAGLEPTNIVFAPLSSQPYSFASVTLEALRFLEYREQ
ncbi:hypothetical protein LY78DRAFT_421613 [Colletotrichum sublineola]|nr:hypothetical protein LY78DRAFT_421613 [Colletotrichum sublineola]